MYDGKPPRRGAGQQYFSQHPLRDAAKLTSVTPKRSRHREGGWSLANSTQPPRSCSTPLIHIPSVTTPWKRWRSILLFGRALAISLAVVEEMRRSSTKHILQASAALVLLFVIRVVSRSAFAKSIGLPGSYSRDCSLGSSGTTMKITKTMLSWIALHTHGRSKPARI